jgi:hypothetical protein
MTYLLASLAVLLVGPLSYRVAARAPWAVRILDGAVVVSVGALVVLHILPETVERGGFVALVPMVIGLLGPSLIERALDGLERQAHTAVLVLVLIGLGVHATMDGVALVLPHDSEGGVLSDSLQLAVVLHRVPVSLLIWWLLRPAYGTLVASVALSIEGMGTIIGYVAAHGLVLHMQSPVITVLQALVAGSLLHVVVDRRDYHAPAGQAH